MPKKSSVRILNSYVILTEGFAMLSLQLLTMISVTSFWGYNYYYWAISLIYSLLGMVIGYALSPRLKKRVPNPSDAIRKVLSAILIYLSIVFAFERSINEFLILAIDSPLTGLVITLFVFYFLPVVLLSSLAILYSNVLVEQSGITKGASSGITFSLSSLGGVIGVSVFSFIFIDWLGLVTCIALLMLSLLLSHTLFSFREKKKVPYTLIAVYFLSVLILVSNHNKEADRFSKIQTIHEEYGLLGKITVLKDIESKRKYLMVNNSIQSVTHFTGRSLNPYVHSISIYGSTLKENSPVLVAGLGAGSIAYEFGELGYDVDVLDIDERLNQIVQEYFLTSKNAYKFIHSDARRYFKTSRKKYDLVVLDISHGENLPSNVYTTEGFKDLQEVLSENGMVLIHFLATQDRDGEKSLSILYNTIISSGLRCMVMNFVNRDKLFNYSENTIEGEPEGFVLIASKNQIALDFDEFKIDPSIITELVPKKDKLFLAHDFEKTLISSDDRPILEYHHRKVALKFRKKTVQEIRFNLENEK